MDRGSFEQSLLSNRSNEVIVHAGQEIIHKVDIEDKYLQLFPHHTNGGACDPLSTLIGCDEKISCWLKCERYRKRPSLVRIIDRQSLVYLIPSRTQTESLSMRLPAKRDIVFCSGLESTADLQLQHLGV